MNLLTETERRFRRGVVAHLVERGIRIAEVGSSSLPNSTINWKDQMSTTLNQAVSHTLHCLLGCSIGEILGMVISTGFKWSNFASIFISIALAFFFGYLLTFQSVYRRNKDTKAAVKTAVATDTVSIISMETVDNGFILLVPGAINANLSSSLFWWSLLVSLIVAFIITVPVNYSIISRSPHDHMHH